MQNLPKELQETILLKYKHVQSQRLYLNRHKKVLNKCIKQIRYISNTSNSINYNNQINKELLLKIKILLIQYEESHSEYHHDKIEEYKLRRHTISSLNYHNYINIAKLAHNDIKLTNEYLSDQLNYIHHIR